MLKAILRACSSSRPSLNYEKDERQKKREDPGFCGYSGVMEERNLPARVKMERAIDRATARAAEQYEENTVLRAAVVSIPLLGGGLDMIFASEGQRAAKERLYKLIEAIKERTVQLEEEAVSKEYLESEEFIDLVMKAFDSATKTRDEKIRWYARILTEATVRQKQGSYFPRSIFT